MTDSLTHWSDHRVASAYAPAVRSRLPADVLLGTCVVIWGFNFTVIKYALGHGFTPLAFGSARFAIATAAFAGVALSRRKSPRVIRRDLLAIMAWSAAIVVNQIGFVYSFRFARASTVALLFGTLPIFAGIYSQLWGIERLNSRRWAAAAVSFAGVCLVAIGVHGGPSGRAGGILIALVAPATFALYSIGLTPYVRKYGTYTVNLLVSLFVLVPLVAVASPQLGSTHWSRDSAARLGEPGLQLAGRIHPDEPALVRRDRTSWDSARLRLREPPAVPRRRLRTRHPVRDDGFFRVARRRRHRRRDHSLANRVGEVEAWLTARSRNRIPRIERRRR